MCQNDGWLVGFNCFCYISRLGIMIPMQNHFLGWVEATTSWSLCHQKRLTGARLKFANHIPLPLARIACWLARCAHSTSIFHCKLMSNPHSILIFFMSQIAWAVCQNKQCWVRILRNSSILKPTNSLNWSWHLGNTTTFALGYRLISVTDLLPEWDYMEIILVPKRKSRNNYQLFENMKHEVINQSKTCPQRFLKQLWMTSWFLPKPGRRAQDLALALGSSELVELLEEKLWGTNSWWKKLTSCKFKSVISRYFIFSQLRS